MTCRLYSITHKWTKHQPRSQGPFSSTLEKVTSYDWSDVSCRFQKKFWSESHCFVSNELIHWAQWGVEIKTSAPPLQSLSWNRRRSSRHVTTRYQGIFSSEEGSRPWERDWMKCMPVCQWGKFVHHTWCAMILSLWRDGCRLNNTTSPSIKWRSTMSPYYNEKLQQQEKCLLNKWTVLE